MDWFEKLTGFRETGYEETQAMLRIDGNRLHSLVNGSSYGIGELELPPLHILRDRARPTGDRRGQLDISLVTGDVRQLHRLPQNDGALFQVASQFNLLEMTSPRVTPEDGVTRYQGDATQGPACAIAAGAATIYRNYFVPVAGHNGQTAARQLDGLVDLGNSLSAATGLPVNELWTMKNGYALATREGLEAIGQYLETLSEELTDHLRGDLRVGLHSDVEVTEAEGPNRPFVSQIFCAALPVAYSQFEPKLWKPLALLVLEAAYEATMWAAVLNARRGASNVVYLTLLGGGSFGNRSRWIHRAIQRALSLVIDFDLDVRIVSFGPPSDDLSALVERVE